MGHRTTREAGAFPLKSILIVEDMPIAREPMARILAHEGYAVSCAANGREAIDVLHAAPRREGGGAAVDLVLLDLMMPRMDGVAFLEAIRRDERWRDLPVIVLTAAMDSTSFGRARELGVATIMSKAHFTVDELLEQVRAHAA